MATGRRKYRHRRYTGTLKPRVRLLIFVSRLETEKGSFPLPPPPCCSFRVFGFNYVSSPTKERYVIQCPRADSLSLSSTRRHVRHCPKTFKVNSFEPKYILYGLFYGAAAHNSGRVIESVFERRNEKKG